MCSLMYSYQTRWFWPSYKFSAPISALFFKTAFQHFICFWCYPGPYLVSPTLHRSPISLALAADTSLNSTQKIYWQLLKNIYCSTSSPCGHLACNLPTRLLDHLSKPWAFLLPPIFLFFLFLPSSTIDTFFKECVCTIKVYIWESRREKGRIRWDRMGPGD